MVKPIDDVVAIFNAHNVELIPSYTELIEVSQDDNNLPLLFVYADEVFDDVSDSTNGLVRCLRIHFFSFARTSVDCITQIENILQPFFVTSQNRYGRREQMPVEVETENENYLVHKFDVLGGIDWQCEKFGLIYLKELVVLFDYSIVEPPTY